MGKIYAALDKYSAEVLWYAPTIRQIHKALDGLNERDDYVITYFDDFPKLMDYIEASKQKSDKHPVIPKDLELPF